MTVMHRTPRLRFERIIAPLAKPPFSLLRYANILSTGLLQPGRWNGAEAPDRMTVICTDVWNEIAEAFSWSVEVHEGDADLLD